MKNYETIDDKRLLHLIEDSSKPMFVLFSSEWQSSIDLISHALEKLAQQYESTFKFIEIDIEKNASVIDIFNIQKVPTFIIFKDGEIIDYFSGILSRKKLEKKLINSLQTSSQM
ncbi:MAG: thioredoxin family protein [Saprospiraceae bacterium]